MTKVLDPTEGIIVYTDGSYSSKSTFGGWAYIAIDHRIVTYTNGGYEPNSTNNRMELMAPIRALKDLHEIYGSIEIEIVSDSLYVVDGITKWIHKWKTSNWISTGGNAVKNQPLWVELEAATLLHSYVNWRHVKGHSGHRWNDMVDQLAVRARNEGEIL